MASVIQSIAGEYKRYKALAEGALAQLSDSELAAPAPGGGNSVATSCWHLGGNLRSRFTDFLTSDGEKPDRHRDQEFALNAATTRGEVMRWWEEGWARVFAALDPLKPEDAMRTVTIRGEPHTVLQAINRQIAHYAQHIGQIVFLAKHLRSSEWQTLSIPRGRSEEVKTNSPRRFDRGLPEDK